MHTPHEHHETTYSYAQDRKENFSLPFAAADLAKELKEVNHIAFGDTEIKMTRGGKERFEDPATGETTEHDVYVVKIKHGKTEAHIALVETSNGVGANSGTRFDMLYTALSEHNRAHNHVAGISRWDKSYDGVYRKLPVDYVTNLSDSDLEAGTIQELVKSLTETMTLATDKLEDGYTYKGSAIPKKAALFAMGTMALLLTACGGMENPQRAQPEHAAANSMPISTPTSTPQTITSDVYYEDRLRAEADMAVKHSIEGTPVPPETWKPLYGLAQKNTVEMAIDGGLCSGTMVNGSAIGRPDVGLIVTAKHCVVDYDVLRDRTGPLSFRVPNQGENMIIVDFSDYGYDYPRTDITDAKTDQDYAVIVIPLSTNQLRIAFKDAIIGVNDTYTGDKDVMASGFPAVYEAQLALLDPAGAKQPLIEVLGPIVNKPEEPIYYFLSRQHPAGYGPKGSGGGVYDEFGAVCGVIKNMSDIPGLESQVGIAPLRNFQTTATQAVANYEGKKG